MAKKPTPPRPVPPPPPRPAAAPPKPPARPAVPPPAKPPARPTVPPKSPAPAPRVPASAPKPGQKPPAPKPGQKPPGPQKPGQKPPGQKPPGTQKPQQKPGQKPPGTQKPQGQKPGQTQQDQQTEQTGSDEFGIQPVEDQYDIPKSKADIEKQAQTQVGYGDRERGGEFTELMSELGFGYGSKTGSGYESYENVFGTPGGEFDPSKFQIRDAMGRAVNTQLLGTDVFAPGAAENVAGTSIGNLILSSRRSAAEAAEGRGDSGIRGGGLAGAQQQAQTVAGQSSINDLLRRLAGGVAGIQSGRFKDYMSALDQASESPGSAVGPVAVEAPKVSSGNQQKPKPKPKPKQKSKPKPKQKPGASPRPKPGVKPPIFKPGKRK